MRVPSFILVDSKSVVKSAADILSIVESITCLYSSVWVIFDFPVVLIAVSCSRHASLYLLLSIITNALPLSAGLITIFLSADNLSKADHWSFLRLFQYFLSFACSKCLMSLVMLSIKDVKRLDLFS